MADETSAVIGQAVESLNETLKDKLEWNRPDANILHRTLTQFRTLRKIVIGDDQKQQTVKELLKADLIEVVLTNAPVILRFVEVTDEATRVIIALSRTFDNALALQVIKSLFENGAIIFVVLAMKAHMLVSQSIRVQGLELLARLLEYVKEGDTKRASRGCGLGASTEHVSSHAKDAVHQMLLHGAAAILVRLLTYSIDSASETAMRRSIYCMKFLVVRTPSQMALKLATYDNYSAVRSLCKTFDGTKTKAAQLDAASLLVCFLSSSVEVAEMITSMGAWDQLSVTLATNAETINVPNEWLLGSLQSIRKLGEDPATRESMERKLVPNVPGDLAREVAVEGSSTLTMPVGNGSVEVSVDGSFENILTSMLESAYQSGKPRRVNKSFSPTTFERGETLNAQYSAAMKMHNSSSVPTLHGIDATRRRRPESSDGRYRQRTGKRVHGVENRGPGPDLPTRPKQPPLTSWQRLG